MGTGAKVSSPGARRASPYTAAELRRLAAESGVDIETITEDQRVELLDRAARRHLKMSGKEFLEDWNAGKFFGSERPELDKVVPYLPLPAPGGQ